MSFRKKCIYVAMASVFTAQTAAAMHDSNIAFIAKAVVNQAVAEGTPGAVAKVKEIIEDMRPQVALGEARNGGIVTWVDDKTGRYLTCDIRKRGPESLKWADATALAAGNTLPGTGNDQANLWLALIAGSRLGIDTPVASHILALALTDDGDLCSSAELLAGDEAGSGDCHGGWRLASFGEWKKMAPNLTEVNKVIAARGGSWVAPGYYEGTMAEDASGTRLAVYALDQAGGVKVEFRDVGEPHLVLACKMG